MPKKVIKSNSTKESIKRFVSCRHAFVAVHYLLAVVFKYLDVFFEADKIETDL